MKSKRNQYLTCPPSAASTSAHRLFILATKLWQNCGRPRKLSHMAWQWVWRASGVLSSAGSHCRTIEPHKFSMGFRSGDLAGQWINCTSGWRLNQSLATRLVCAGQLSCTNHMGSGAGRSVRTDGYRTSSRIFTYSAPAIY